MLIFKELLKANRTLRRIETIAKYLYRFNCEVGHVLDKDILRKQVGPHGGFGNKSAAFSSNSSTISLKKANSSYLV